MENGSDEQRCSTFARMYIVLVQTYTYSVLPILKTVPNVNRMRQPTTEKRLFVVCSKFKKTKRKTGTEMQTNRCQRLATNEKKYEKNEHHDDDN